MERECFVTGTVIGTGTEIGTGKVIRTVMRIKPVIFTEWQKTEKVIETGTAIITGHSLERKKKKELLLNR